MSIMSNMNFPFEIISKISFSPTSIANMLFFLVAGFVAIVSIILFFHWRKYAVEGGAILAFTELAYLSVSVLLLAVSFFALP